MLTLLLLMKKKELFRSENTSNLTHDFLYDKFDK